MEKHAPFTINRRQGTSLLNFHSPHTFSVAVWSFLAAAVIGGKLAASTATAAAPVPLLLLNGFLLLCIAALTASFLRRCSLLHLISVLTVVVIIGATYYEILHLFPQYYARSTPCTFLYLTAILVYFLLLAFSTYFLPLPLTLGVLAAGGLYFYFLTVNMHHVSPLLAPLLICGYLFVFSISLSLRITSAHMQALRRLYRQLNRSMAALIEREKHMSLMRMTAGLSHQINNPLTYGKGHMQLLDETCASLHSRLSELGVSDGDMVSLLQEQRDSSEKVNDSLRRIQRVVTRLRYFAHHPEDPPDTIGLDAILFSCITMTSQARDQRIRCTTAVPTPMPYYGRPKDFFTLFSNLLENALDALSALPPGQGRIWISARRGARGIVITFTDNGPGLPPELQERVFEPFYTTRQAEGHLGLGLSMCSTVVDRYGGSIAISSEEGRWTRVDVKLPPAGHLHSTTRG